MRLRFGLVLFLLVSQAAAQSTALDQVRQYRREKASAILRDFAQLLSIPNVASDLDNIRRNARHIREQFEKRGARMEIWELSGVPPVVFGEIQTPGAGRTLIFYVHYDGQPVVASHWTRPPWEPTLFSRSLEDGGVPIDWPEAGEEIDPEWRVYARSAGDDKAPITAILAALDALQAAGTPLTSNLKFFFEGEEEAGSTNLRSYLETHRDRLEGDIWLFCDGPVHQSRKPQLVYGVRGVVGMEITVYGPSRYLHSGHYGNWAPNPALLLSQLLAGMKDDQGNVLVQGYYDSVLPVSQEAQRAIAAVPAIDDSLRLELGLTTTENDNQPLMERLMLPSLNLRGIVSASVGESARNVIPTEATASLDLRLVPGNDPQKMLDLVEEHIRRQGYHIVREAPDRDTRLSHARIARVTRSQGYPAARTPLDHPVAGQILQAASRAAGQDVLQVPWLGGSLPLYLFTDYLESPVLIVPLANHDDNQHAPDENLRLANLWYGIDLMASFLTMP